jgi:hypothetical protein
MKFVSKNANLMVVLRPGIPAQPITGTPAVPTLSARFQDGVVDIQDEKMIEMMLRHPAFNNDFIAIDSDGGKDPFESLRQPQEPAHAITEIKYGTPEKRTVVGGKTTLPPEIQKLIQDQATAIAKEMLPGMVKATLEAMAASQKEASEPKESEPTEEPATVAKKGKK